MNSERRHTGMANGKKREYFLLQYMPKPLSKDTIDIGLVFLESENLRGGFCRARFGRNWQASVLRIDSNADIEILEALARDISARLTAPDSRKEMLNLLETSFSSVVRVSGR